MVQDDGTKPVRYTLNRDVARFLIAYTIDAVAVGAQFEAYCY